MKKAEEIGPEEIMIEAKEEVRKAPSRLRKKLRQFEAMWERASIQFYKAPKN
jgi:uncharacterized protein YukE